MATEYKLSYTAAQIDEKLGKIADKLDAPATAQVGQILKVSAVDENGKPTAWEAVDETQPDWNQNDETAKDYVKNRPFWTDDPVETVLFDVDVALVHDEEYSIIWPSLANGEPIVEGQTYIVTWGGTVYECVGVNLDGTPFIGNPAIWLDEYADQDNGMPFCIYEYNGVLYCGTHNPEADTSVNVRVVTYVAEVHKIDEKYLPDTVLLKSETSDYQISCVDLFKIKDIHYLDNIEHSETFDITTEEWEKLFNIAIEASVYEKYIVCVRSSYVGLGINPNDGNVNLFYSHISQDMYVEIYRTTLVFDNDNQTVTATYEYKQAGLNLTT